MLAELKLVAEAAWCTKQTEDVIGMVQHHEGRQSSAPTPKTAWLACAQSKVLTERSQSKDVTIVLTVLGLRERSMQMQMFLSKSLGNPASIEETS
eukprot:1233441-Amphidinium_carterae.1